MNALKRITYLGVTDEMDFRLAKRIVLSNQFALIIALLTSIFMVIAILRPHFNFLPFVILLGTATAILFFNKTGLTRLSRLVTSLMPAFGLLFLNLSLKIDDPGAVDILHYATPRMLILGSVILPFTMFSPQEWGYLLLAVLTILLVSFGYDIIHQLTQVDHGSLGIKNDYYNIIYEDLVVLTVIILSASGFMYRLGHQYDQKSSKLLEDAINQTEQLKQNEEIMKKTLQELEESRKKDEARNWVSKGLADTMAILQSTEDTSKILEKMLAHLIRYTGLNQGAFFVVGEGENENAVLTMAACYAYDRKKHVELSVDAGTGILGQAYLDGKRAYLKQVPSDYVRITSGLGEAPPNHLVVVPMKLNNKVEGMMELAGFYPMEEHHFELFEKLGEAMASFISTNRVNTHTKSLLQQAQTMSQELKENEEEMRQNMEELQATQEEMARKEKEMGALVKDAKTQEEELKKRLQEIERIKEEAAKEAERMLQAIENSKKDVIEILNYVPEKVFLKDSKGYMILCNQAVAQVYNLPVGELIGTHDYDHFEKNLAKSYFEKEQEIIKNGAETFIQEEKLTGELRLLKTTKMPFFIHHLNELGLLGIQTDITEIANFERREEQLKKQIEELKQLLQ